MICFVDVINVYKICGRSVDEALVMYYAIEMLRIVEGIHKAGIIHGDIKPDNFLLRAEEQRGDGTMGPWSNWAAEGAAGWSKRGLLLIDFGRSLDRGLYPRDTAFSGDR